MTNNYQFSPRELEVITFLMQGKSNKEIAYALGITNRTVESHLTSVYAILGVESRTEAVIKLQNVDLRKSTGESDGYFPRNPQLKKGADKIIFKRNFIVHRNRSRNNLMKSLSRFLITILLIILLATLIIALFAYLRQL